MKESNRDKTIMALAGIVFFFILPKDPWSFGQYVYLFFCSTIGSIGSIFFKQKYYQSILISALIGTSLFILGTFIVDIILEPNNKKYASEFLMWFPILIINCFLYIAAVTFAVYPIVTIGFDKIKR